jgi:hypothetical protein
VLGLAGGEVDDVGAVEPGQVDGLGGVVREPVQGGAGGRDDLVAVDVGRADEQRAHPDAVPRPGRVGLHPAQLHQGAEQHVQAGLGVADGLLDGGQGVHARAAREVLEQFHRADGGLDLRPAGIGS